MSKMSKWIRNQSSKDESLTEKVTFYVNTESDPHIAEWIRSIPYGKTGKHIRTAIDFYLEHGQAVMPDKTSSRRKQSARQAPPSTSFEVVRKTAPAPSPTLTAVDSAQKAAVAPVAYRGDDNLEATSEPISSIARTPVQTPSSIPDPGPVPAPAPISTSAITPAVNSTSSPPPALDPESPLSDSVLDSDEQEANSLDDIDPQALALQMELANRFSF